MKRWIVSLAGLLLCWVVATVVLSRIPYLVVVPNLLLIYVVSEGLLCGSLRGLAVGVLAGLLCDVYGGQIIGVYAVIYMYIGFFSGVLFERVDTELPVVPAGMILVADLFYHFCVYVLRFLIRARLSVGAYLSQVVLPELVITIITGILLYGVLLVIHNAVIRQERQDFMRFS